MITEFNKSSRHNTITGSFAENLTLYWLSKHNFECSIIDHTGIDIIAKNPLTNELMGISVKCRSRYEGTEASELTLKKDELELVDKACNAFNCVPYFAFVVDAFNTIQIYIVKKDKFLKMFPPRINPSWKMSKKQIENYKADKEIIKIELNYNVSSWWEAKPEKKSKVRSMALTMALFASFLITSCSSRIGNLTMVSTRNIDSKTEYVELKRYNKANGKTIESAIEDCMKEVKGGEFIRNCKIYRRSGIRVLFAGRYKVEGDVWGIKQE
jgi:hypothetical protein